MGIYEELKESGTKLDSHCSDLYARVCLKSTSIVNRYEFKRNVRVFTSPLDGQRWYDIPFAFTPYWEKQRAEKAGVSGTRTH